MSAARRFEAGDGAAVTLERAGAVARITLRRPAKANALDLPMLAALEAALDAAEADTSARVLLLTAEGKMFSAGGDVGAWSDLAPAAFAVEWVRRGHRVFDRLARLRPATIAVLEGSAMGGGLELAAACDFRVAEAQAQVGLPEAGIGVVPGWSGTQRLARRFGAQVVRRMALGGERFDAESARALGIVDRVAPTGEGAAAAQAWAEAIAARAPLASGAVKTMLAIAEGEDREAAVEALASAFVASTEDLAEGVAAFRGKRAAAFEGR